MHQKLDAVIQFDPRPPCLRLDHIEIGELNNISLQTEKTMWETIIKIQYFTLSLDEQDILTEQANMLINNLTPSEFLGPLEIIPEQGDAAWLAERRLLVTASKEDPCQGKSCKIPNCGIKLCKG